MPVSKMAKCAVLYAARGLGLFLIARWLTARGVRVLGYHGAWIGDDGFKGDSMFIGPDTFRRRLDTLERLGYPVIPLSRAVASLRGQGDAPSGSVVITIDDGWYSSYEVMIPELSRRKMPATIYCDTAHLVDDAPVPHILATYLPKFTEGAQLCARTRKTYEKATNVDAKKTKRQEAAEQLAQQLGVDVTPYLERRVFDYMTPSELAEVHGKGIDIQLHTHTHSLHDFSAAKIREEIEENRKALAAIVDQPPQAFKHFCYPSGRTNENALPVLASLGMASATTTEPGLAYPDNDVLLIPRMLDTEAKTDIEFEAELCGFMDLVRRRALPAMRRVMRPARKSMNPALR